MHHKLHKGITYKLCGGYVSWDSRKKKNEEELFGSIGKNFLMRFVEFIMNGSKNG